MSISSPRRFTKALSEKLKSPEITPVPALAPELAPLETPAVPQNPRPDGGGAGAHTTISIAGRIPPEQWNRLGTRLIPKMRAAGTVTATIRLDIELDQSRATALSAELRQIVGEAGLSGSVRIDLGTS